MDGAWLENPWDDTVVLVWRAKRQDEQHELIKDNERKNNHYQHRGMVVADRQESIGSGRHETTTT